MGIYCIAAFFLFFFRFWFFPKLVESGVAYILIERRYLKIVSHLIRRARMLKFLCIGVPEFKYFEGIYVKIQILQRLRCRCLYIFSFGALNSS